MKEKLLEVAKQILDDVDSTTLETVEINNTEYDDGSVGISINLTYPPKPKSLEPLTTPVSRTKVDGMDVLQQLNK